MNHLSNIFEDDRGLAVKVKTGAAWQSYDIARLQISVGQDYHEGSAFAATLKWVERNFPKTIICVNDTLQRHNMEFSGASAEDAFLRSNDAGREWVERNLPLIRTLPDFEIIRWEHWRAQSGYQEKQEQVQHLYAQDNYTRRTIDGEVENFWRRMNKQQSLSSQYDFAKFHRHSRAYLIEECAVFQLMFAREEAADIYPGSTLIPCTLFKKGDAEVAGKRFTRIDFRRNAGKISNGPTDMGIPVSG